jgi:TonB family protein
MPHANVLGLCPVHKALRPSLALIACALLSSSTFLHAQAASEYQVKAAYLYNFAKLAQWPPEAVPNSDSTFAFCVVGDDDDFVNVLRTTMAGKSIGAHSLTVKPASAAGDLKSCRVIFFRASESARALEVISDLRESGVLLVGEDGDFLASGGMVNLLLQDGKVRFQVNTSALERAHLQYDTSFFAMASTGTGGGTVQSEGTRGVRSKVTAQYPRLARKMNLTGTVQLAAVVRPDGTVEEVRVLGGHPVLAEAASEAVRQWRFRPAPGETVEVVKITFAQLANTDGIFLAMAVAGDRFSAASGIDADFRPDHSSLNLHRRDLGDRDALFGRAEQA